jgi:hypothetical protein
MQAVKKINKCLTFICSDDGQVEGEASGEINSKAKKSTETLASRSHLAASQNATSEDRNQSTCEESCARTLPGSVNVLESQSVEPPAKD